YLHCHPLRPRRRDLGRSPVLRQYSCSHNDWKGGNAVLARLAVLLHRYCPSAPQAVDPKPPQVRWRFCFRRIHWFSTDPRTWFTRCASQSTLRSLTESLPSTWRRVQEPSALLGGS